MVKNKVTVMALLLIGALGGGCQSDKDAIQKAENEVFAIHDEVMPQFDDIMKLRKQIRQRIAVIDSVKATGSTSATLRTDEERAQAERLVRELTVADSLMMGWMGQYKNDTLAKLSKDDAMRYLAEQKEKITDVKTKFDASLEQARQFLDKQ